MIKPFAAKSFESVKKICAQKAQHLVSVPFFKGQVQLKPSLQKDVFQKTGNSHEISFEGKKNKFPDEVVHELIKDIPTDKQNLACGVLNAASNLNSNGIQKVKSISHEQVEGQATRLVNNEIIKEDVIRDRFRLSVTADGYNDVKFDRSTDLDNVVCAASYPKFQLNDCPVSQLKEFANLLICALSKENSTAIKKGTKAYELKSAIVEKYRNKLDNKEIKLSSQYSKIIESVYSDVKALEELYKSGAKISNINDEDSKKLKTVLSEYFNSTDVGDISKYYSIETKFGKKFYRNDGQLAAINNDDTYNLYIDSTKRINCKLNDDNSVIKTGRWSVVRKGPATIVKDNTKDRGKKIYDLIENEINSNEELKNTIIRQSKTTSSSKEMASLILNNENIQQGLFDLGCYDFILAMSVGDEGSILLSTNGKRAEDIDTYRSFIAETQNKFSGKCAESALFAQMSQDKHKSEKFENLYVVHIKLDDGDNKYKPVKEPPCETCEQGRLLYKMHYED